MNLDQKLSKGQVIVLFAIGLVVLLAVGALVIDGGQSYMHRRQAQAAADAGALAGAYEMCGGNTANIVSTAERYAEVENWVSNATAHIETKEVVVEVVINQPSFLAQLLGYNQTPITAMAAAGCYNPSLAKLIPIAFSCRAPVGETDSPDCQLISYDWVTEFNPLLTGHPNPVTLHTLESPVSTPHVFNDLLPGLYIVMDNLDMEFDLSKSCKPPIGTGTIQCDIDGDGNFDVMSGGARSWLDLTVQGGGASEIKNWLNGTGNPALLTIHTWYGSKNGASTSGFKEAYDNIVDQVSLVPVFNAFCSKHESHGVCEDAAHPPDPISGGDIWKDSSQDKFHVVAFAPFYTTCVKVKPKDNCPGNTLFGQVNPGYKGKSSIEGYFVHGYPAGAGAPGAGGVDMGVYVRSLTR